MQLVDQAFSFIEHGGDQIGLLTDCVEALNLDGLAAVQRLAEDMYGGITYNYELKAPAAFCLVAWRSDGLRALVEMAHRTPTSKNRSLTLEILATLASRDQLPQGLTWVKSLQLWQLVIGDVESWDELYETARALLNEYVLDLDDEEAASAVASSLSKHVYHHPAAARELYWALGARWLALGSSVVDKFDHLMAAYPKDEDALHAFLEDHPQLLDPMVAEAWSKPDLHGALEPDFVVRRVADSYLVVELETPFKKMVTASNQLTAVTTQAVTQALEYRAFLLEHFSEASTVFTRFSDPECLVIIGREDQLSQKQYRALKRENEARPRVRIVGFDQLSRRARTIAANVMRGDCRADKVRMV